MIRVAIEIRKPPDDAKEEEAMFSDSYSGAFANHSYMKMNGYLYPQEPFSHDKSQNLPVLDKQPFLHPATADGLMNGNLIVYVLTKTKYGDKYGALPEARTCWTFHYDKWTEKFKSDTCLLVISGFPQNSP
jgi:hypothetical protein